MNNNMGKLIVIEGPDTSGKSTLINKLKIALPNTLISKDFIFTREPGNLLKGENSYNKSESIRTRLLTDKTLTSHEQANLFAMARYFHTLDIIKELKEGKNVIVDRYFLSSLFYQGPIIGFTEVININKNIMDTLTENNIDVYNIILSINEETYNERISRRNKDALEDVSDAIVKDRINYYNNAIKICEMYLNNCKAFNTDNMFLIDATQNAESVLLETLYCIYKIVK